MFTYCVFQRIAALVVNKGGIEAKSSKGIELNLRAEIPTRTIFTD